MSGLPPLATELRTSLEVRFVPRTEAARAQSINLSARNSSYAHFTLVVPLLAYLQDRTIFASRIC